jgi:hypothetical protein
MNISLTCARAARLRLKYLVPQFERTQVAPPNAQPATGCSGAAWPSA